MRLSMLAASAACVVSLCPMPAAASDFILAPGTTYSLVLQSQSSFLSGNGLAWQDSSAGVAQYRVELLYPAYPDTRFCEGTDYGCAPFTGSDSRTYTAQASPADRVFEPFVMFYGSYFFQSASLRFVSLSGSAITINSLRNLDPRLAIVPEPSTWVLMLAGFAMMGYALRRRPRVAYAA